LPIAVRDMLEDYTILHVFHNLTRIKVH
jgi:hypothetical protein